MTKIAIWTKELGSLEREMTADEQAEHDAKEAAYIIERPAIKLAEIKRIRLTKLRETDYLALSDTTLSVSMSNYRQGLRDIPQDNTTEEQYDLILARDGDKNLTHAIWSKP